MEKIAVWGDQIPGNSPESKFPDMKINRNAGKLMTYLRFFFALSRKRYKDCRSAYDTFTYRTCIKRGTDKETYGDVPYLVPFPVEGSDRAVIVVPGGGFCFKSTDTDGEGNQSEGDLIAKALNEAGVSAVVLWYRGGVLPRSRQDRRHRVQRRGISGRRTHQHHRGNRSVSGGLCPG